MCGTEWVKNLSEEMEQKEAFSKFPQVATARSAFKSGKTLPLEFRRQQLTRLSQLLDENRQLICEAIYKDLRRTSNETILFEVVGTKIEINKLLSLLNSNCKDEVLPLNLLAFTDKAYIRHEPHGVVLILSPFNYPIHLTLVPLAGIIASGNCAIIKPSELTLNSALLMDKLIPKYLDNECYQCIISGPMESVSLLENKFDYIFYTGGITVAKSVMAAAAKHLTPVTLELGGKSPCYIDDSANLKTTAKRILWGKVINMGQTCVAPDYLLCSKEVERSFVKFTKEIFEEWYGGSDNASMKNFTSLSRIVNTRHFRRLKTLMDTKGHIVFGGATDEDDLWIQPSLVVDVQHDDALMDEEIFGPILPIVTVNSVDEAIEFIIIRSKPLAAYIFSTDDNVTKKFIDNTASGGVTVNDVMFHCADSRLPFGGIGDSGFGKVHGKFSLLTFTHQRAVLKRSLSHLSEKLSEIRYPPFTSKKLNIFEKSLLNLHRFELNINLVTIFTHGIVLAIGIVLATVLPKLF